MSEFERAIDACSWELIQWYDGERPSPYEEPTRGRLSAGFAITTALRKSFPISEQDFITPGNQVKISGAAVAKILSRCGENRRLSAEGGRTTRGTRTAAERLAHRLNSLSELTELSVEERGVVADVLQEWLTERATDYFNRQKIKIEVDISKPAPQIIADILESSKLLGGAVAQHLVGAKLALRHPSIPIENHNFTTADLQLGRHGDFQVGDTIFHVTVSPMPAVLEKCTRNLRSGYRTVLLVPEDRVAAARQMAEQMSLQKVGILSLQAFVGQNIEEMGEFSTSSIATQLRALLDLYNQRVSSAETDRALLIEIPENLM